MKVCISAIRQRVGLHHLHKQCGACRDIMLGKPAVRYFRSWLRVKPNKRMTLDIKAILQVSGLCERVSGGASIWL